MADQLANFCIPLTRNPLLTADAAKSIVCSRCFGFRPHCVALALLLWGRFHRPCDQSGLTRTPTAADAWHRRFVAVTCRAGAGGQPGAPPNRRWCCLRVCRLTGRAFSPSLMYATTPVALVAGRCTGASVIAGAAAVALAQQRLPGRVGGSGTATGCWRAVLTTGSCRSADNDQRNMACRVDGRYRHRIQVPAARHLRRAVSSDRRSPFARQRKAGYRDRPRRQPIDQS